ncbi:hypothetical protein [Campylobacter hyointestinalis]|uniref:hypothetical protein n=1 Tax=Campylobacter hyointestinalis TaxID=198 RepID=UPI000727DCC9|nr:hypothetical protein [Campylobacter hyointestinalis]CUU90642.1 Uncharacterised protein [Campylobacter hyointestinalis subsp. hyointestinalis]
MTEDQLWNLSDEELEKLVLEQRSNEAKNESEDNSDGLQNKTEEEINDTTKSSQIEASEEVPYNVNKDSSLAEEMDNKSTEENIEPSVQTYKIKANGKEYDFTLDELATLASKGMDYTKKTTAIKPYRTIISAMQDNGISSDDINLLIDIKKGNKEALARLVHDSGTDVYDIPENSENYSPTNYGKSEIALNFEESINKIKNDAEFSRTSQVYSAFDEESKNFLYSTSGALEGLHKDIQSGLFDKVLPLAEKMASLDGGSKPMVEYYIAAGQQYLASLNNKPQPPQANPTIPKSNNNPTNMQRKQVAIPQTGTTASQSKNYIDALYEDDDPEFDKWYANLQRSI